MITDAELLELETLLICKYTSHKFDKIYHNEISNEIIAFREDLELLVSKDFPDRYRTFNNKVIMSLDLFNLLKMRYFPRNESVIIKKIDFHSN